MIHESDKPTVQDGDDLRTSASDGNGRGDLATVAMEALIRAGEDARAEAKRWGTLLWYSDGKTIHGVDPTTNEVVEERPAGPREAS